MSRPFIHEDFLLQTKAARELYHGYAKDQPILDFHNHLLPDQIANNHQFAHLQEAWLAGDHYKWRAMRTNGVSENDITGTASPETKFKAWAATVPYTLRNPLYHWTHLELSRYFGIGTLLDSTTADAIWEEANAKLPHLRIHDILKQQNVTHLCTTDDPADPLDHHLAIKASGLPTKVLPTFRPDKAVSILSASGFNTWVEKLETITNSKISTLDDLLGALKTRHDAFHELGARVSDHGINHGLQKPAPRAEAARIFAKVRGGQDASDEEQDAYTSVVMHEIATWNAARGWVMQLHIGALRNGNSRIMRNLGADSGTDSIASFTRIQELSDFLNNLDDADQLPRTILYNLDPANNYIFGTLIGNHQDGTIPGKVQLGSGWWFLDQKEGMEWQLNALSSLGLLRRFVGMVTDSRSFLSFTRHEYFRRVLCNLLGTDIENGELPNELPLVGQLVKEVCYSNAKQYFSFPG
ncbi:MAG: glucuronate isomerase [Luteolibacter sp.]